MSVNSSLSFAAHIKDTLPLFRNLHSASAHELEALTSLMSQFTLFKNMPSKSPSFKNDLHKLFSFLDYQIYQPCTALYHEGSFDDKVYFLLQGIVNTYIPKSSNEIEEKENAAPTLTSISQQIPKLVTYKDISRLNAAAPKVLEKLIQEINERKAQVIHDSSKPVTRRRIHSIESDTAGKRMNTVAQEARHSSVLMNVKTELNEPEESKQLQKLSNVIFSRLKSKSEVGINKKINVSQATSTSQMNLTEEFDELKALEELKKTVNESIGESTARILKRFPKKMHKYFSADKCLFKQFGEYGCGACLGNTGDQKAAADHSAICATEVHVLVCQRKKFMECFQAVMFEKNQRTNFFTACLGGLADPLEINYFMQHFAKRSYGLGEILFYEGAKADGLYLVHRGEVQLKLKADNVETFDSNLPPNAKKKTAPQVKQSSLQMALLGPHQFFGEEALQEESRRQFTAIAMGRQTEVYFIQIEAINLIKNTCRAIINHLETQYKKKNELRSQRMRTVAEANKITVTEGELPFYQYKSTRKFDMYIKPKAKRTSSVSHGESLGEMIAYELNNTIEKRNRIEKLMKLRGLDLVKDLKEIEAIRKASMKRAPSLDLRIEKNRQDTKSLITEAKIPTVREEYRNETRRRSAVEYEEKKNGQGLRYEEMASGRTIESQREDERYPIRIVKRPEKLNRSSVISEVEDLNRFSVREETVKTYKKDREKEKSRIEDTNLKELIKSQIVTTQKKKIFTTIPGQEQNIGKENQGYLQEDDVEEKSYDEKMLQDFIQRSEQASIEARMSNKMRVPRKEKLGVMRNMLLYNEISGLVVQRDLLEKHKLKEMKKKKSPNTARQSMDEKEDRNTERLRHKLLAVKWTFAKRGKKAKETRSQTSLDGIEINGSLIRRTEEGTLETQKNSNR